MTFSTKRFGLRPCSADPTSMEAQTNAGRELLAASVCWADWHIGRTSIRRQVERGVSAIEHEAAEKALADAIDIIQQTIDTMRAEDPDGELRSVQIGIAAREHAITMLTAYRESIR